VRALLQLGNIWQATNIRTDDRSPSHNTAQAAPPGKIPCPPQLDPSPQRAPPRRPSSPGTKAAAISKEREPSPD